MALVCMGVVVLQPIHLDERFPFLFADLDRDVILVTDVRICDLLICGVIVEKFAVRRRRLFLLVQMIR